MCCPTVVHMFFRYVTKFVFALKMSIFYPTNQKQDLLAEACPNSKWSLDGMVAGTAEAAAQIGRISLFRRILDNHCPGFPLKLVVWDRENETKAIQLCHFI